MLCRCSECQGCKALSSETCKQNNEIICAGCLEKKQCYYTLFCLAWTEQQKYELIHKQLVHGSGYALDTSRHEFLSSLECLLTDEGKLLLIPRDVGDLPEKPTDQGPGLANEARPPSIKLNSHKPSASSPRADSSFRVAISPDLQEVLAGQQPLSISLWAHVTLIFNETGPESFPPFLDSSLERVPAFKRV
jgi:hypothetical protein